MGVNSLPKTVSLQCRGCDLNLGPTAPGSSTITTHSATEPPLSFIVICNLSKSNIGQCYRFSAKMI